MKLTIETLPRYVTEVGDCWHWLASCNSGGYPQANIGGRVDLVVRHLWTLMGKTVPSRRYCLVTTCGDRLCVNPAHIAMRSRSTVLRKAYEAGARMNPMEYHRRLFGSRHLAKLTAEQVDSIRARPPEQTHAAIAREFGVSAKCVSEIRRGITWRQAAGVASVFVWRPAPNASAAKAAVETARARAFSAPEPSLEESHEALQ